MRRGIILAGGNGTRLAPITNVVSKQLIPVYDKPLIFYSLSSMMMAGVYQIIIITTAEHLPSFKQLLGAGKHLGLNITYAVQDAPNGIAEAYLIAEEFLDGNPSALILGDNIFFGSKIKNQIKEVSRNLEKILS